MNSFSFFDAIVEVSWNGLFLKGIAVQIAKTFEIWLEIALKKRF